MRESSYSKQGEKPEFWFNLKSLKVEIGPQVAASYRVGPFATEAEAKNALALLRQRSTAWAEEESETEK